MLFEWIMAVSLITSMQSKRLPPHVHYNSSSGVIIIMYSGSGARYTGRSNSLHPRFHGGISSVNLKTTKIQRYTWAAVSVYLQLMYHSWVSFRKTETTWAILSRKGFKKCKGLEKAMAPHSSTLAWKIPRWRSLVGCSPWSRWESDTTERLHFHALEKEMATHSSVLACRIPGTGEPGGLPSMGLQSRTWLKWFSSTSSSSFVYET